MTAAGRAIPLGGIKTQNTSMIDEIDEHLISLWNELKQDMENDQLIPVVEGSGVL